uniref:Uncharacterized protein n=1 Tax=Plectus sambesii TaxID=2011161 RepID=A0A914XJG1_9BILA
MKLLAITFCFFIAALAVVKNIEAVDTIDSPPIIDECFSCPKGTICYHQRCIPTWISATPPIYTHPPYTIRPPIDTLEEIVNPTK